MDNNMNASLIEQRLSAVFAKEDPHLIPILSYKGRGHLFNRIVSTWSKGPYSHTEAVLSNLNPQLGAEPLFLMGSSSFRDGGVRMKSFRIDDDKWDLRVIRSKASIQEAFDWFALHDKDSYSVLGLLGLFIAQPQENNGSSFCNESVGLSIGLKEAWRYDPNSFFQFIDLIATGD